MRCTICFSGSTRMIERTCKLIYVNGGFVDCQMSELWLCNACGNAFHPAVSRLMPWHLRWRLSPKRKRQGGPQYRHIPKTEVVKELFAKGG